MTIHDLRRLCAGVWNPIGIPMRGIDEAGEGEYTPPADEYDGYLRHAWRLASSGAAAGEIVAYLAAVAFGHPGLASPLGDRDAFAAALLARARPSGTARR